MCRDTTLIQSLRRYGERSSKRITAADRQRFTPNALNLDSAGTAVYPHENFLAYVPYPAGMNPYGLGGASSLQLPGGGQADVSGNLSAGEFPFCTNGGNATAFLGHCC
ncbi:hypothetical protein [Paenibacillus durus]|uniref:hypothetical protein n=1 Tax=Paenibacillus durus TaxID=44251 RepID=UPI000B1F0D44|nr:hypothetical protein [Paenibacillus durus]